ncbi:MAG: flavin reductase family protein [Lachnospiraceae bacterium]|nr:flavin reductase family protein [Lachnospiraceae bacterium]
MGRQTWKPGNMLYPLPAVLVSVADKAGRQNLFTVAWTGTVCSDPPMVSISVRPERYSYSMIEETGEFVINLTTEQLAYATDYCGVRSGRDVDKWKEMKLTQVRGEYVMAAMVAESPVNLECRVVQKLELGTHHMFLAKVLAVHVDERYLDEKGSFHLNDARPLVYSHGRYLSIGDELGTFGYSVRKYSLQDKKLRDKKLQDKKLKASARNRKPASSGNKQRPNQTGRSGKK